MSNFYTCEDCGNLYNDYIGNLGNQCHRCKEKEDQKESD